MKAVEDYVHRNYGGKKDVKDLPLLKKLSNSFL